MLAIRLFAIGLLAVVLGAVSTARAGVQLYRGSWIAESFGNDKVGGRGASASFFVFGMPQGVLCNPYAPPCNFSSTPVSVTPITSVEHFNPLGPYCTPYTVFVPLGGSTMRPAKGATPTAKGPGDRRIPPFYRNPFFFTPTFGKYPKTTSCTAASTVGGGYATMFLTTNDPLRGKAMKGAPVSGFGIADTTTPGPGGAFTFAAAPATPTITPGPTKQGMRRTTSGEFNSSFPYLYSYTYARLRNDAASFKAGGGFFTKNASNATVTIPYTVDGITVAKAVVKAGQNRFGGVMKLLGGLTTKSCYVTLGSCSLGSGQNWRYEVIGAGGISNGYGTVTAGKIYNFTLMYVHPVYVGYTVIVSASRFPWTTGSVYVTATGRGSNKTVERRRGYDNRTPTYGRGAIQLVSPILTRWLIPGPAGDFETGGIAILRMRLPEPQKWILLAAGLSLLGVLYLIRGRVLPII